MPQTTRLPEEFYSNPGNATATLDTATCRRIYEETGGVITDNDGREWRICSKSAGAGQRQVCLEPMKTPEKPEASQACETCKMVRALVKSTLTQLAGNIPEGAEGRDLAFGKLENAIGSFMAIRDWVESDLTK